MAAIIEELRYAMRLRLFEAKIIDPAEFQAEGKNAPENATFYIRETITSLDVTADFQTSSLHQFLVDYDIFADRKTYAAVISQLYSVSEQIRDEFAYTKDRESISLPELPNCKAYLSKIVQYGSVSQEGEFFRLPVQVYVNVQESI